VSLCLLLALVTGFTWPWEKSKPWPSSSKQPVVTLDHPTLEAFIANEGLDPSQGFNFAVFGDQRALADGEWQTLNRSIVERYGDELLFVWDTGDIVNAGQHSDQFHMLREILWPLRDLPYVVSVGNHELNQMKSQQGMQNTATILAYLDPTFSGDRRYYAKHLGPVSLFVLDTNPLVYGVDGKGEIPKQLESGPFQEQLDWLAADIVAANERAQLEGSLTPRIIVGFHHPFLQTSEKHRGIARALWALKVGDETFPRWLLSQGVDIVVSGHTHTYERFRLENGGDHLHFINISGRPRTSFLWIGDGARRAQDVQGKELEFFDDKGFEDLDGWQIEQLGAMTEKDTNQFGLFRVGESGSLRLQMHFVDTEGRVRADTTAALD